MTRLDEKALDALQRVSMRTGSNGKRFRRDIAWQRERNPGLKLTERQALFLWQLVHLYRLQVADEELKRIGAQAKEAGRLPDIYRDDDLAPPKGKGKRVVLLSAPIRRRLERELAAGGGTLRL
jgi:hypothetical protein